MTARVDYLTLVVAECLSVGETSLEGQSMFLAVVTKEVLERAGKIALERKEKGWSTA